MYSVHTLSPIPYYPTAFVLASQNPPFPILSFTSASALVRSCSPYPIIPLLPHPQSAAPYAEPSKPKENRTINPRSAGPSINSHLELAFPELSRSLYCCPPPLASSSFIVVSPSLVDCFRRPHREPALDHRLATRHLGFWDLSPATKASLARQYRLVNFQVHRRKFCSRSNAFRALVCRHNGIQGELTKTCAYVSTTTTTAITIIGLHKLLAVAICPRGSQPFVLFVEP